MDFDSPDTNVRRTPRKTKDGLHFYPVSPGGSGEGLPYAPEDWPNPGDKWRWKVGKRVKASGYSKDRYLYLPRRLVKAGQPKSFQSKFSVEQYVQSAFPGTDVNAFFASFRWNIPLKWFNSKEAELLEADSRLSHTCKAGNNMCSSLSGVSDPPPPEAMFCDICCSEPGFCRSCCCILCSKITSSEFGSYSYIRCKAILLDGCICGHIAHIDCALQAHMVGTVGRSYDLDAVYFCRRCDSMTDLVSHVMELLQICESIDSRDEIEKILNSAISILHGSSNMKARQLLHHIESVMAKLKNGANFEDMWKKEESVLEVLTAQAKVTKKRRTTHGKPRKDDVKWKRQRMTAHPKVTKKRRTTHGKPRKDDAKWKRQRMTAQPMVTKKRRTTHGKPRKDDAEGKRQRMTAEPNAPDTDNDFTISPTLFLHRIRRGKVFDRMVNICAAFNEMTIDGRSQTVVDNEATLHTKAVDIRCIETQLQLDDSMAQKLNNEEVQHDKQMSFSSDSMFRNDEETVVVHENSVLSGELKRVKFWRKWRLMPIAGLHFRCFRKSALRQFVARSSGRTSGRWQSQSQQASSSQTVAPPPITHSSPVAGRSRRWSTSAAALRPPVSGLASALWAARNIYSADLVSNPAQTLRLILASESPVVILLYSLFRHDSDRCSYFKALGRGLLSLPVGAVMIAVGAIILGAPVGFQYLGMTLYWSLVMSVFTFVPAATVFGSSWTDWHRIFAQSKPAKKIDYMVFFPAHGAIIGAWFGAWPMPLDWERPWQEWPICVTYGAMAGYFVGMAVSMGFILFHNRLHHIKGE
nr:protein OBERON 1-like isoform X1 [Ipomoea batatas]